jgi:hypothetical protein
LGRQFNICGVGLLGLLDKGMQQNHFGLLHSKKARVRCGCRSCYLWAVLIARIYEVFPLVCPICGGPMRIIAFITYSADIRQIAALVWELAAG